MKHSLLRGLLAGHSATLLWGALFVPLSAGRTALRLAAGLSIVLGILLIAYPLALVASLGAYMLASSALILVCAGLQATASKFTLNRPLQTDIEM